MLFNFTFRDILNGLTPTSLLNGTRDTVECLCISVSEFGSSVGMVGADMMFVSFVDLHSLGNILEGE